MSIRDCTVGNGTLTIEEKENPIVKIEGEESSLGDKSKNKVGKKQKPSFNFILSFF